MEWTDAEQAAIRDFLAGGGPLKSGLEKLFNAIADQQRQSCAGAMATVPRDPERAADHAAKAQLLDEIWTICMDVLTHQV